MANYWLKETGQRTFVCGDCQFESGIVRISGLKKVMRAVRKVQEDVERCFLSLKFMIPLTL